MYEREEILLFVSHYLCLIKIKEIVEFYILKKKKINYYLVIISLMLILTQLFNLNKIRDRWKNII